MAVNVALVRCDRYDPGEVYRAIRRGIELLGGFRALFKRGEKILLKPNLLAADPPETATTTHPAVFEAAAKLLVDGGVRVVYGDSPSFSDPRRAFEKSGMAEAARRLDLPMADFVNTRRVFFKKGIQNKVFDVAEGALDCDGIVSLPKLKTHALTLLTGAVKNQFGCIPGTAKSAFHGKLCRVSDFAQMLADLTALLAPKLYVMDAVTAMEGNGPRRGAPVRIGALLLSRDPVALDATASRIAGVRPDLVLPVVKGAESGLGLMEGFDIVGEGIEEFETRLALPRRAAPDRTLGPLTRSLFMRMLIPRPVISRARCVKCGECLAICPTTPKSISIRSDGYPRHEYGTCICCYCCQESCPAGAISVRVRPF